MHSYKTSMRILFFLLLTGCTWYAANSQVCRVVAGYAYQQSTISGKAPEKSLDETGKQVEAPVKGMNTYFIYLEIKGACAVEATGILIDGKAYRLIQEEILQFPVVIYNSDPRTKPDTLVKQTNNKVFRLHPKDPLPYAARNKIVSTRPKAKIIIEYRIRSKTHFYAMRQVKKITPMVLQ